MIEDIIPPTDGDESDKMKKDKIIKLVLWCAVALWMALIFNFSAQTATESLETSDSVLEVVLRFLDSSFEKLSEAEQAARCEWLSFYIRKAAHFSVFGVLGVLCAAAVSRYTVSVAVSGITAAAISIAYAVSDEIHQHFVPGRACRIFDICVDSAGSLVGIAVFMLILCYVRKRKSQTE